MNMNNMDQWIWVAAAAISMTTLLYYRRIDSPLPLPDTKASMPMTRVDHEPLPADGEIPPVMAKAISATVSKTVPASMNSPRVALEYVEEEIDQFAAYVVDKISSAAGKGVILLQVVNVLDISKEHDSYKIAHIGMTINMHVHKPTKTALKLRVELVVLPSGKIYITKILSLIHI